MRGASEMNDRQLPMIRANSKELDQIFTMFAAAQELEHAEKYMERRVRAIPNGWRDLRLCRTLLDKMVVNLVGTLQPEKLKAMKRMLPRMKFKVICGTHASHSKDDETILAMNDLDTLVHFAHEANCKMCMEANCRACKLGKTLDAVLTYDRNEDSWAAIDIYTEDT